MEQKDTDGAWWPLHAMINPQNSGTDHLKLQPFELCLLVGQDVRSSARVITSPAGGFAVTRAWHCHSRLSEIVLVAEKRVLWMPSIAQFPGELTLDKHSITFTMLNIKSRDFLTTVLHLLSCACEAAFKCQQSWLPKI